MHTAHKRRSPLAILPLFALAMVVNPLWFLACFIGPEPVEYSYTHDDMRQLLRDMEPTQRFEQDGKTYELTLTIKGTYEEMGFDYKRATHNDYQPLARLLHALPDLISTANACGEPHEPLMALSFDGEATLVELTPDGERLVVIEAAAFTGANFHVPDYNLTVGHIDGLEIHHDDIILSVEYYSPEVEHIDLKLNQTTFFDGADPYP